MNLRRSSLVLSFAAAFAGCEASSPSAKDRARLQTFTGHSESVCSVALHPDGKRLLSGGADGKIKFWDIESGQCLRTLDGHQDWVQSIALSPDGRYLASGGRDALVKVWDVQSGATLKSFAGHSELVTSVAYSPDGRLVASCGRDKALRIWDVASGQSWKALETDDFFTASEVLFGPDGRHVLLAGDSLQWWDIEAGRCERTLEDHTDSVGAIAISRDGRRFASAGSYEDRTLRLWDAESGECLWKKSFTEREGGAWSLAFASADSLLASGHHGGSIRYWDVESGKALRRDDAHSEVVSSLSSDIHGRSLASGSWDRSIKLWKVPARDPAGRSSGPDGDGARAQR
jgi:WD40 repeat protein